MTSSVGPAPGVVPRAAAGLLAWLAAPDARRGITFLDGAGGERRWGYDELRHRVLGAAQRLADATGLGPGDRALLLMGTGPGYVVAFFAVLLLGGVVVPAYPPRLSERRGAYRDRLRLIHDSVDPAVVLVEDRYVDAALEVAEAPVRVVAESVLLEAGPAPAHVPPARPDGGPRLIQFTSGSTSRPRGVVLHEEQLLANIAAIIDRVPPRPDDRLVSWLPLYHDMGLIGMLILPAAYQLDLFLMAPEVFAMRPSRWLECFSRRGGTVSGFPGAALEHCLRRVSPEAGMDLSRWRAALVGAEPVNARVLRAFARAFEGRGFSARALCPGFGLAEATLAATVTAPEDDAMVVPAAGGALRPLMAGGDADLVALGRPLDGMRVEIRNPDGRPVDAGGEGEIWVGGPSVARGYHDRSDETADVFRAGWCRTGDTGRLVDGQLVFLGRGADRLSAHGRNLYAEDLEAALFGMPGVHPGSLAVVLGTSGAAGRVTVLWEVRGSRASAEERAPAIAARLARLVGAGVPVEVLAVERGGIPRTTSGKLRRGAAAGLRGPVLARLG